VPLEEAIIFESKRLNIDADREDKSLLKLKYRCFDRYQGAICLNALMDIYQDHLRDDQKRILDEQVQYLQLRQDHMQGKLQKMMDAHATVLAADAINTGFLNSTRAMEFLARQIQDHSQQLMRIDLELKCLENAQKEGPQSLERWVSRDEAASINDTLARLRALQQQADSLDLALRSRENQSSHSTFNFSTEIAELEKAQQRSADAKMLLSNLQNGIPLNPSPLLLEDSQYMIQEWCDKLNASPSPQSWNSCAKNFVAYLSNLNHLFQVKSKAIQEHLTNKQNKDSDFPGLDLHGARTLYVDYNRQEDGIEATLIKYRFIIDQMQQPEFEISALSTILDDPVSKNMIAEASEAQLAIKDQKNRSVKEVERMTYDLAVHRKFIEAHLQQAILLQELNKKLLQDKSLALQRVSLRLTHQEISILQEHLSDYIKRRMDILVQEQGTLQQHQQELQHEIAKWPTQWVSEMLIEQQMDMNKKMVEEVTKLVESRNISSNIEVVQSTPVDIATPPLQPKSPYIILFGVLGAFLGAFLPVAWSMLRSLTNGMPVTVDNLKLSNFNVAGSFSNGYRGNASKPLLDDDLATLRHITTFLQQSSQQATGNIGLLLNSGQQDYSTDLASLLTKKGLKVLRIPLSFEHAADSKELGLLQFLEGTASWPQIHSIQGHHYIASGGVCRYANELLGTATFKSLLQKLSNEYDWILLVSSCRPNAPEAQTLLQYAQSGIITITNQTWPEIQDTINTGKPLSFVFAETV
jgi:tyrosine-protein kinase Etk/Wzc